MKTDLVEIFQTIRANLQPYTANGFTARVNSETEYELWSEKLFDANGKKIDVVPFASISIKEDHVYFCLLSIHSNAELKETVNPELLKLSKKNDFCFAVSNIDEKMVDHIINALGINFANFKQKGWV